jgi:hypothetical protein
LKISNINIRCVTWFIVEEIIILFNTLGQNSNVGKLKTLSGALDIMVRTEHAFQLIQKELVEEFDQVNGENHYLWFLCPTLSDKFIYGTYL